MIPGSHFNSSDDATRAIANAIMNLQKVSSDLVELYSSMHFALLSQLKKQIGFNVSDYEKEREEYLKQVLAEKEAAQDARFGVVPVDDAIQNGDVVKLIVEYTVGNQLVTNRNAGGSHYVVGQNQLVPELESALINKKAGDKFLIDINEAGRVIQHTVDIVAVKRKRGKSIDV